MDNTKEDIYSIDLSDLTTSISTTTIANTDGYYGAVPPIISVTGPGITTAGSWIIDETRLSSPPSGKLTLKGEDADIEINGRSLTQILDGIEQRLGLIKCREDLEKDWHELKELGDRYREKVKHIEEKVKIWDALKR